MHMADALLSPAIGGTMVVAAAGAVAYCSARVKAGLDDRKVPLMGVLGAFLFAAQLINFTIPATGSSGHLGGGLLLTILLGPHAAFLTIASVLVLQALFFADGGLLALGCNIINLGIFPAFIAYPLIYRPIAGRTPPPGEIGVASMAAAIVGLQLGAFAVVLETVLSGISALPFTAFVSLMQPIHLAIGVIEGVVTAIIVGFVHKARPDIFIDCGKVKHGFMKSIVPAFLALALVTGSVISWFASEKPDGLEWSIKQVTGKEKPDGAKEGLHGRLAALQEKLAFLPDYNFKKPGEKGPESAPATAEAAKPEAGGKKGGNRLGTSVAGIVGALLTMGLTLLIGFILRKRQQLAATRPHSHEHAHPHSHEHEHLHSHGDTSHSHGHSHVHSHPHPHVHDHSQPHQADPNPQHSHEAMVTVHSHGHDDGEHGCHEHHHDTHSK